MKMNSTITLDNRETLHYELSQNVSTDSIVILCHGLGTSMDSTTNRHLCNYLQAKGLSSIRFDFYGHGTSSGSFESLTLSECVYDIHTMIRVVKEKFGYQSIGIIGSSFGGLASLCAVSKQLQAIKCLGLIAPITDPTLVPKIVANSLRLPLEQWKGRTIQYDDSRKLNYQFCDDALNYTYSPEPITIPILLAHGTKDFIVPMSESERIFWSKDNCLMLAAKNIEHGYQSNPIYDTMLDMITTFMAHTLFDYSDHEND